MIITVIVKTGMREDAIKKDKLSGNYLVSVKARPIAGEANDTIIKLLSSELSVAKSKIRLKSGSKSKVKLFEF